MTATTPYRSPVSPDPANHGRASLGRDGFTPAVRAEWTKFRTVRGWVIGALVGVLAMAGLGLLASAGGQSSCQAVGANGGPSSGSCGGGISFLLGPDGEPVNDSFYFVRQPLAGDGGVTVRVTALTERVQPPNSGGSDATVPGVVPWAKAGLIIKENLTQGSAYAAIMVSAGHGVRMQWNYTGDTAGLSGTAGPANPRWLRLTRSGDVVTGYDSADGTHWFTVGTVTLAGLPSTAQVGLLTASPDYSQHVGEGFGGGTSSYSSPSQATAVFDHFGTSGGWTAARSRWAGGYVGSPEVSGIGGYHQAGGQYTVTGQGDIAPIPSGHGGEADPAVTVSDYLVGTFAGLIALTVIAALFVTAEYRRGLIRLTFAATPARGRVLAAKSAVVAAVGFLAGLAGAAVAVLAGEAITKARGSYAFPVSAMAEARVIIGTGIIAALFAVLAMAIAVIMRRGAAAVAVAIMVIVIPYFLAVFAAVPLSAGDWLLRIMPAAGFALQQPYPAYGQVSMFYAPFSGYFPLSAWGGLAVLAAWTAAALALAACLLRRRDA